ncbi:MAG: aminotransferase [Thermoproteota archaeon]|nr:MAG: aminotransferase [Candidatus Korarchaeota archaeon]
MCPPDGEKSLKDMRDEMRFESLFAERAKKMRASEIRELLKVTQQPDIISFAGGLPNPESFPKGIISEIMKGVLDSDMASRALQYGSTEGLPELRDVILKRFEERFGYKGDRDNIIITTGSQQGLDLLGRIFIGSRSHIIMEAPTYLGALNAFKFYNPSIHTVPLDENGIMPSLLEEKIKTLHRRGETPKFLYTVPNFHNPAGVTLSLERRRELLEIASEYDLLVVEDDPYGELRYEGEHLPPLLSLDKEDRVIYLGTFSKVLSPGMRLAWAIGPKEVIKKMVLAKQGVDLCTSTLSQVIALEYLSGGHMDRHIPNIIELYRKKRDLMLSSMEESFPEEMAWTRPEGGMFIWVRGPEGLDTKELFPYAIEKKVAFVVGEAFYPDRSVKNAMRLNFTNPSDEDIPVGIKRLSEVLEHFLKERDLKRGGEEELIIGV